jgi:hypothetical protein
MLKLTNGRKVVANESDLEDVILEKNIILRFLEWLHKQMCAENLTFWLETQNFKYLKDDDAIRDEGTRLYEKYFTTNTLNIDDPAIMRELEYRKKLPDRTLYMGVQNVIWGLLRLDSFSKFRAEYGKSMNEKINNKYLKNMMKMDPYTVEIYDKFLQLNLENPQKSSDMKFRPNVLPNDEYNEHLHQNLPDMGELFKDREMMLAFREYLYQQQTSENLSFFLYSVIFSNVIRDNELEAVANEIYNSYLSQSAKTQINIDYILQRKLNEDIKKPNRQMFDGVKDRIQKVLENEWFPLFITSNLYKDCNEELVNFKITSGRERSKTMDNYDIYVEHLRKIRELNGDLDENVSINNNNTNEHDDDKKERRKKKKDEKKKKRDDVTND